MIPLLAFLFESNGVIVTPAANGYWTCRICTASSLFANTIKHRPRCAYGVEAKRYAKQKKGTR